MKKLKIYFLLSICSISCIVSAMHSFDDIFDIFDTPEAMEFLSEDSIEGILQHHRNVSPETIMQQLVDAGIIPLLEEDLYCHTNPFNQRSLLDFPLFELLHCDYKGRWVTGFDFFYNQMSDSFYTDHSDRLSSYLNFASESFIDKIQNSVTPLIDAFSDEDYNIDIAKILCIAANLKTHQRRTGFMIHGMRQWKKWRLRFLFPLYYLERNLFLTDAERDAIAEEFGFDTEQEDEEFQDAHFISDKLGFGDTRLEIERKVFTDKRARVRAGIQLTIPTAFALKKGLKGSSFARFKNACLPAPTLIEDIFCDILDPAGPQIQKAFDELTAFALGALDRLSANLLDTSLGNGGHVGIGAILRINSDLNKTIHLPWAENVHVCHRGSIEYLFPKDEKIFYVEKNNAAAFEDRDFTNDAQAAANLAFLEQELVKRFYPVAVDTTVQPGIIWRWLSRLDYLGAHAGANFGFDFWLQTENKLISMDTPCFGDMTLHLDKDRAKIGYACQGQFFGGINGKIEQATRIWFLGIQADGTLFSRGIGHDWTVTFNVEVNF
ncbi:MAG TPA: hypothetical protein PLU71_04940 [Candidatus Dependentiae bacterium]|mgnify:CR=1 FL=1|nr:hypothetical protein [Candidatus Dependentiae bacterium]HRQ63181.1 hypothetical protein [Candidatus Dependentiae bacterium]